MAVKVDEKFESRIIRTGQNPSGELRFTIQGTTDDAEARKALSVSAPVCVDVWGDLTQVLMLDSLVVTPIGPELWEGVVQYSAFPYDDQYAFSFDTGGGTQHVTQSLQTVGRYAPSGKTAPDFKGAIGVTGDGVEGVDITVPVYQFTETHSVPDELVTPAYKEALFRLTGRVNNAPFRGFQPGECLFLGASGTKRGLSDWEIAFRFAGSENVEGLVVGAITGINKKGWEYLWVRYEESTDAAAHCLVKQPRAAYVEKVYRDGDFALLGIGT